MNNGKTSFLLCMVSWLSSTLLKSGILISKATEFVHNLTLLETKITQLSWVTDCLTNRRTDCEGMTNRKPSVRYLSDLLSLSQEVRPPFFHIAHWTAQHSVDKDDILRLYSFIYVRKFVDQIVLPQTFYDLRKKRREQG